MIVKPSNLSFSDQKFTMILYGSPGLGKTTLALSAPDPILFDFDRGVSRVKAIHRKETSICNTYEEVLADLQNVGAYQTIVIDTGGSFISMLQAWAMHKDPKLNCQRNGALSQKGFGAVKQEFQHFSAFCREQLRKNVIFVFHSIEEKDRDGTPIQRLLCEGSAKNLVWQPCDFGAYMQMIGDKRYICFSPEQEFFAKGCHGISGRREVPNLSDTDNNDLLTRIFAEAKENIAKEASMFAETNAKYETIMKQVNSIIKNITNAEEANKAMNEILSLEHVLTSKREASALLKAKADSLKLRFNAEVKKYE